MAGGDGKYEDPLIGRPGGGLSGRTGRLPDQADMGGAAEVEKVYGSRPLPNSPEILAQVLGVAEALGVGKNAGNTSDDSSSPAMNAGEPPDAPTLDK
jgi:hypothetical protein